MYGYLRLCIGMYGYVASVMYDYVGLCMAI